MVGMICAAHLTLGVVWRLNIAFVSSLGNQTKPNRRADFTLNEAVMAFISNRPLDSFFRLNFRSKLC